MIKEKFYPFEVDYHQSNSTQVKIAFMEEGEGEKTILFLHGLGHSSLGWVKNIAGLKSSFHCIAIDLPGNGLSSCDMEYPYSIHFFARSIHDFIQEKKLKNVYLAGHSMGGQIALMYAHLFPDELKGLILCAPAGLETFGFWEKTMFKSTLQIFDFLNSEENNLKQAIHNSFYHMPRDTQKLIDGLIKVMNYQDKKHYKYMIETCINGMLFEPVFDLLPEIKIPVLVLFGENDNLIPNKLIHPVSVKSFAKKAIQKLSDVKLSVIPRCGHLLQWEKPDEVNKLIKAFLKAH